MQAIHGHLQVQEAVQVEAAITHLAPVQHIHLADPQGVALKAPIRLVDRAVRVKVLIHPADHPAAQAAVEVLQLAQAPPGHQVLPVHQVEVAEAVVGVDKHLTFFTL